MENIEETVNQTPKSEGKKNDKAGRPPNNKLMLFKALIIQSLYNLSDEQLEYQILDRSSFKQFLGLKKSDRVPDSRTFWHFREQLISLGAIESLFSIFNTQLDQSGVFANEGKMVDASFVEVPRQRNTREENKERKEGKIPVSWGENSHKLAQKDTDARWTKKSNISFYGYKNPGAAAQCIRRLVRYIAFVGFAVLYKAALFQLFVDVVVRLVPETDKLLPFVLQGVQVQDADLGSRNKKDSQSLNCKSFL